MRYAVDLYAEVLIGDGFFHVVGIRTEKGSDIP